MSDWTTGTNIYDDIYEMIKELNKIIITDELLFSNKANSNTEFALFVKQPMHPTSVVITNRVYEQLQHNTPIQIEWTWWERIKLKFLIKFGWKKKLKGAKIV